MPPPSASSDSRSTLLTRWGCAARAKIGARRSRRSEDRFQSLASASPLGVFSLSADGACEYANERLCTMTGRAEAHLSGTGLSLAFHPDDRAALHKAVTAAGGPSAALRLRLLLPDGALRWVKTHAAPLRDSAGRVSGWVGSVEDVTTEVEAQIASRQIAADLTHKSRHDHLTGLPNRTFFTEQVAELLADDEIGGSVIFVDLDRFKVVNESLGHGAGDELLNLFAERLRAAARPGDLLARFGADEFVVGLVGVRDPIPAVAEAHRMLAALADTMLVGGHEVMVTVSIGVAVDDDCDAATLVTRADMAMFQAKARGKARVELHRPEAPSSTGESTLEIEARLRAAIDNDELRLHYQPVLSVRTREVLGVEALVRWQHPDRGLLAPGEFIPLAEESGLIVALGTWVLRTACAQLRQWRPALHAGPAFTLSVNVSARQLADPLFLSIVAGALRDHAVAPGSLCLEITETALLQDLETVDEVLRSLRAVGVRIAVDDFGTGYSSLSHLKLLPVDVIKVDRSFVKELGIDADDTAIVGAVIRLAGALGMTSVAEGVEEPDQLNWLGSLGCDMAQGFLLCRPQPADAIGAMLRGPRIVLPQGSTSLAPDAAVTADPITPSGR